MLPAIVFIFSRAACEDAVAQCVSDGVRLTTGEERREIRRRCERHTEALSDDELRVLRYGPWLAGLEVGVAPHHAGMIPAFRQAVEDCFSAGLLQVVFATETLALGINMPARTVVIERLTKVRQHGRSGLTSGEYAQMTGRAGRRGLDVVGHAVVPWTPQLSMAGLAALATSPAPELVSSFRPTYNLAVNLVRRYPAEQTHDILEHSFAQFRDQRHRHALSRRLDAALALLDRWGHVELESWRLTDRGAILARIYHESDLLVAEALTDGLFDELSPPVLAGVVSGCTFEARAGRLAHERRLPKSVVGPFERLEALAERLRSDEEAHHLPLTRRTDGSLAGAMSAWAGGERLERVLERAELPAGDFVRNARQLIDVLRQLALVSPVRATGEAAARAAAGLERGVVAASADPASAQDRTEETEATESGKAAAAPEMERKEGQVNGGVEPA